MGMDQCLTEVCNEVCNVANDVGKIFFTLIDPIQYVSETSLSEDLDIVPVPVYVNSSLLFVINKDSCFHVGTEVIAAPVGSISGYALWRRTNCIVTRHTHGYSCTCLQFVRSRTCPNPFLVE